MSPERSYPPNVEQYPLWRSLPANEELLELILARTASTYFKGFHFIENDRKAKKELVIYAPRMAIKLLEKTVHSADYYTLKYAYAADDLDRFYRIDSSWKAQDLVKLNYLFWKRKAKAADELYNYWVQESKRTSVERVSDICLANAYLYRHSYLGSLMIGEEVRLTANPAISSSGPLKLTYELMAKLVTKQLSRSAYSQE